MKTIVAATLAATTLAGSMTLGAGEANAYYRGRGAAIGLGIAGGVIAGAAIAGAARRPYYYDEPAYYDGPVCHWERRRVYLDDVTYTYRRVRVCD